MRAVAGSTSGRFVSVCGAIGVSTSASTRRMHDRAAGRQVVGGRSGRRRDDQTVGLHVTDELAVDVDVDLDHARQRAARDDDVVEREAFATVLPAALDAAVEHQARLDVRPAGEERFERAVELRRGRPR